MFAIQNYQSFIVAVLLFQFIPGAGTVVILSAASNGIRSGMAAVCGILLVDFFYMVSAVLGLAALLQEFPAVLTVAQYLGAVYLCLLGLQKIFLTIKQDIPENKPLPDNRKIFSQAVAICLTNPKAIMFFMVFFPLFLSPESKPVTLVIMMLHITIISLIYQSLLVVMGSSVRQLLCRWQYTKRIATRLAGVAFIVFAVKLARDIR